MYLLANCTDSRGYFPINTKWGSTSTLSGILPGGGLRYFQRPKLSYFRPNFAMARGNYPGQQSVGAPNLGQLEIDPTLGLAGVGLLALGMYVLGRPKKRPPKRRAGKIRRVAQLLAE